jgi:hypothetical protein
MVVSWVLSSVGSLGCDMAWHAEMKHTRAADTMSNFGYKFILMLFLCVKYLAKIHKFMGMGDLIGR